VSEPVHNESVVAEGLGFLTSMFAKQPNVRNILTAILTERQKLEDVMFAVYAGRNLRGAALFALPTTNSVLDAIGALVGQPRDGLSDAQYQPVIFLRAAVNRATGRATDWSKFATILLGFSGGGVEYYQGEASFFFFVGNMHIDPVVVASVLFDAVPNGIGPGVFAYSTWADGNDFMWGSVYDATAGQGKWGSTYDATVGGLLVASFWLGHLGLGGGVVPAPGDDDMFILVAPGLAPTTSSGTSIPATDVVARLSILVTTPYAGAGAVTLSVGQTGTPGLLVSGFDLTHAGLFEIDVFDIWGSSLPVLATIAGSPASGACQVLVQYGVPQP
jgi:hypothetical protein